MLNTRLNFCDTRLISVCNAVEKDLQRECRFYDKSSYGDRCMFFHFEKFCDNLEAQRETGKIEAN